jgi:RNA polymerase sigma factor (sigma-70 family)
MITTEMISSPLKDSALVSESLSGNRDAFGQIVSRYQSLICSLAYSATGSLSLSEDLAQDTFVTAWKRLRDLREPEKLRSWLCGIARNIINSSLRKQGREPSHHAKLLEEIPENPSPEPLPVEHTISKEEAEILWRSLERIPENYREPLILFYREHQSIETVAANLELSEDAVKQRLSRGRKLLQERVLAFVEGALAQTNPGSAFTLSVLSALPVLTFSAKVAMLGAAAKGGATAKGFGFLGLFGMIFSPILVIASNYASYRMSLNDAHSDQERHHIKRFFSISLLITTILSTIVAVLLFFKLHNATGRWEACVVILGQILVIYFLTLAVLFFVSLQPRRRYLAHILTEKYAGQFPPDAFEYRSQKTLFGWPLVHVRWGDRFDVLRPPIKAWIAVGSSHAVGLIFAFGGLAIAPLSFGGIAIGLVPLGAIALGVFSFGAGAFGVWAYGAAAVGWQVFCGCGIAWHAATGGIVAARDFAMGAIAHAAQANNEIAQTFFQRDIFSRISHWLSDHSLLMMLLWVIPVSLQARIVTRAQRRREQINSRS